MSWNNVIPVDIILKRIEDSEECKKLVLEFFNGNKKKTKFWFDTPNPLLGKVSPNQMINSRRVYKLLKWIKTQLEENKI